MSFIEEVLRRTRTITFDCYGTLIDWRAGLSRSFGELFGPAAADRTEELFKAYVQIEAEVEAEGYQPYRGVLGTAALRLARRFGFDLPTQRAGLLAEMLPQWPPFADTCDALARLKSAGYRLGVLSNIDRDLFAGTARRLDVAFDFVVTAEDVRAEPRGFSPREFAQAKACGSARAITSCTRLRVCSTTVCQPASSALHMCGSTGTREGTRRR